MYLIDTNVISEARKGNRANADVRAFWRDTVEQDVYIAVQTVGEIRQGLQAVRNRGDHAQADLLENWLGSILDQYADHILDFDVETAQIWGSLMATNPHNAIDKQIAAIALLHDLTIVTRNVDDFLDTGATLMNPFTDK